MIKFKNPSKDMLIAYKTIEHEIISCNYAYLKFSGVKSFDDLYGLTDYELPWKEYTEIYHTQEKDCLKQNIYSAIHPGCDGNNNKCVILDTKLPLIDKNNEVTGVISLTINISSPYFLELFQLLNKNQDTSLDKNYFINKEIKKNKLTPREMECLFYLIRGRTAKHIAKILQLSPRTVEIYIDKLKVKFDCTNKADVIYKAIEEGYMKIIPNSLLNKDLLEGLKT